MEPTQKRKQNQVDTGLHAIFTHWVFCANCFTLLLIPRPHNAEWWDEWWIEKNAEGSYHDTMSTFVRKKQASVNHSCWPQNRVSQAHKGTCNPVRAHEPRWCNTAKSSLFVLFTVVTAPSLWLLITPYYAYIMGNTLIRADICILSFLAVWKYSNKLARTENVLSPAVSEN
jgi:hypothetical protein